MKKPKAGTQELRSISKCELRAESEGVISGYAALFDTPSKPIGGTFVEVIKRGAFDKTLQSDEDVKFTFNHSQNAILSRTKNGTLELEADEKGLHFRGQLNMAILSHRDLWEACNSGLYDECSFAFLCPPNGDSWSGNTRTLNKITLLDVSLVGEPAYNGTSASARAAQLAAASSTDATLDAQNRAKAASFQFVKDDAKIDAANRAALARLAAEVRGQDDQQDDDDPSDSEADEYNSAIHDMNVVGWTDDKIFTSENGGSESCAYDYCRDDDGAIELDRSSRTVL
jgi:HK97 family phage prohead protease